MAEDKPWHVHSVRAPCDHKRAGVFVYHRAARFDQRRRAQDENQIKAFFPFVFRVSWSGLYRGRGRDDSEIHFVSRPSGLFAGGGVVLGALLQRAWKFAHRTNSPTKVERRGGKAACGIDRGRRALHFWIAADLLRSRRTPAHGED